MAEQFTNKAQTILNGAITDVATSMIVTSATGFPTAGNFHLLLRAEGANQDEIVTVTAVSGTTYTIKRATESVSGVQAASAHGNGATVSHVLTAGALRAFTQGDGKPRLYSASDPINAIDDEFSDGPAQSGPVNGLDAKWSKHNLGTASWLRLSDTYAPGALGWDIPTGQTAEQWIYQTAPGGSFTVAINFALIYSGDRQMFSLAILDTNGTGIGIRMDTGGGPQLMDITTWAQTGSVTTLEPNLQSPFQYGIPLYMWLQFASGTTYNAAISIGDQGQFALMQQASRTRSFTIAYVGFGRSFGTGITKGVLDFFRVA